LLLIKKIPREVLISLSVDGTEKDSREFVEENRSKTAGSKLHLWQYGGVVLCP
jgi:hypothetical protein